MATTGFWPVKGALKKVVDYAENPDKTTERKYLDNDLARAIEYAADDAKTDRKMYVSGINCSKSSACEDMMAIQKKYGFRGTNVAYHGYQSFKPGEVTPEIAHQIGIETAKRMWGDRYQVVVTTHLNTDSVHNHMVVNSVSFVDGKKFQNHISDHIRLREISDAICKERGLSVLKGSPFYGSEKNAYWIKQKGGITHRNILKKDIEECIRYSITYSEFFRQLESKGYIIDYTRWSVRAPSWERGVRLERMGYSEENLYARLDQNIYTPVITPHWNDHQPNRDMRFPLLELEKQLDFRIAHSRDTAVVVVDTVFMILLQLLKLTKDEQAGKAYYRPLSPELRMEMAKLDEITAQVTLMAKNGIHTMADLDKFISDTREQIAALESERKDLRADKRRIDPSKSPDLAEEMNQKAKDITLLLKPLRKALRIAERAKGKSMRYCGLLEIEHKLEMSQLEKTQQKEKHHKELEYR